MRGLSHTGSATAVARTPVASTSWDATRVRASFVVAMVGLGLGHLHPALAPAAWLGVAALGAGLTAASTRPLSTTLGWLLVVTAGSLAISFPWLFEMFEKIQPGSAARNVGFTIGFYLVIAAPIAACVALGYAALRRWPASIPVWLPLAWGLGEQLRLWITDVSLSDWLVSQWSVRPVLRAVGWLGWWPTLALCLAASASLGVAIVQRRHVHLVAPAVVAITLVSLPALPRGDLEQLRGVAVIHTDSTVDLPHRAPPGGELQLVVWPEVVFGMHPSLGEGPGRGAIVPPPQSMGGADHLVGLETVLPGVGRHNQVVALSDRGEVIGSRAKRVLFPMMERSFLGLGRDWLVRGRAIARLDVAGRSLIPLVCGEYLTRAMVAEGKAEGGELLTISARDWMFPSEIVTRQLLAVQVLRAVEYGVPAVRSSFGGQASIVAADGEVLAVGDRHSSGVLTWSPEAGASDHDFLGRPIAGTSAAATDEEVVEATPVTATVAVIFSAATPDLRPLCPQGRCRYHEIERFECGTERASTVIVAGHGAPGRYLGQDALALAAAIRCFEPELVILDVCFGASAPLLHALGDRPLRVIGSTRRLAGEGLRLGSAVFEDGPVSVRAAAARATHDGLVEIELGTDAGRQTVAELGRPAQALDRWHHARTRGRPGA